MSDLRENPKLRELAVRAESFALRWSDGQEGKADLLADLKYLQDEGKALGGEDKAAEGLVKLAANYEDTPERRKALARSAWEVLRKPENLISRTARVVIGCYLAALATIVLAITPWAWSLATSTVGHNAHRARFLGFSFRPTIEFTLIIIVTLMAVLGSIAVMIITFANRAGQETLERGFVWWYLTRPFEAAAVGVLFYMVIIAGLFNEPSGTGRSGMVLAAAIGGLAGLFTDNVLQKMSSALGLSSFHAPAATAKQVPNTRGSDS